MNNIQQALTNAANVRAINARSGEIMADMRSSALAGTAEYVAEEDVQGLDYNVDSHTQEDNHTNKESDESFEKDPATIARRERLDNEWFQFERDDSRYDVGRLPNEGDIQRISADKRIELFQEATDLKDFFARHKGSHEETIEKFAKAHTEMYNAKAALDSESAYWDLRNSASNAQKAAIFGYRQLQGAIRSMNWARQKRDQEAFTEAQDRLDAARPRIAYGLIVTSAIAATWDIVADDNAKPILDMKWYPTLLWLEIARLKKAPDRQAEQLKAMDAVMDFAKSDIQSVDVNISF